MVFPFFKIGFIKFLISVKNKALKFLLRIQNPV